MSKPRDPHPPIMAVDESLFKRALGLFASGVTVVTTEHEGERHGITVSAFSSLSLNPPLVLICIEKEARAHDLIARAERFAVNILAHDQEDLSRLFASRPENKFARAAARPGLLGVPLLEGALATIECRLRHSLPGGDHTIFVGEVVGAEIREGEPLLYFKAAYRKLL